MAAVIFTDPQDKAAVRNGIVVDKRAVGNLRGNEDEVTETQRIGFFSNLYADVSFYEKIKFIIIVCVEVYFLRSVVIIVIEFKIFGDHVLSGLESGLKILFHNCKVLSVKIYENAWCFGILYI